MYRLMLLLVGVSAALAASVGTGYASPAVLDVLSAAAAQSFLDVAVMLNSSRLLVGRGRAGDARNESCSITRGSVA